MRIYPVDAERIFTTFVRSQIEFEHEKCMHRVPLPYFIYFASNWMDRRMDSAKNSSRFRLNASFGLLSARPAYHHSAC